MKKFKKIYVEITNVCNLSCSFCPSSMRKKQFMKVKEFERILEQIKPFTDYIYLHIKGEPLLHPNLKEILNLCERFKIKVNITTNGTLIDEKIDILKEAKSIHQINFSLHCENNTPAYCEKIFERVEELSPKIVIIYRYWTLKEGQMDEKSTEIVEKIQNYYHLSTEIVEKIKTEDNVKIKENIYVQKANQFEWPSVDQKQRTKGYCYGLKSHIGILVDGTVVPCCLDAEGIINLGNINQQELKEILENKRCKAIEKGFQNRNPSEELCRHCTFKNRF